MRPIVCLLLAVLSLFVSGCLLDPNSRFNVNRGEHHDENDMVGKVGRGDTAGEKDVDPMGQWLYSPEARAINRNLGVGN
jgi:hypothetical protein